MFVQVSARALIRVAALVTALSLMTTGVALADDMVSDGDGGVVNTFPYQFGNVCVGQTYTGSITVYLQRAWPAASPTDQSRTFNGGSTVSFGPASPTTTNAALTASIPVANNSILLPATWRTDTATYFNGYIYTGDTATVNLSLTPTALGPSGTVTIAVTASGIGGNTGTTPVNRTTQAPRATWTGITGATCNTAPSAPGKPAPTPVSPNQGGFTLNWTASTDDGNPNPPGAVTYSLEGHRTSESFASVASGITSNSHSFTAGNPAEGTWIYRVRASDSALTSGYSNESDPVVVDRTAPGFGSCPAGGPFLLNSGGGSQSVGPISASDGNLPDGSAGSGLNAGASTLSGSVDTTSTGTKTVTFTAVDNAGNSDSTGCDYTVYEVDPPTVNVNFPAADGDNGWHVTTPVVGSVSASDISNVTAISCSGATAGSPSGLNTPSASASLTVSAEGTSNVSCTATDGAGNSGAAAGSSNTATINLDSVAPSVSLVGGPADGATYTLGSVPAAPTCNASDGTSGLAGACSVSGYSAALGTHTVTASAEDNAGNTNSASATYTVVWNWTGFFRPVDNPSTLNTVKAGQAIPVKFSLGGNQGLDIFADGSPTSIGIVCDISSTADPIEQTATAGNSSLSYDATTDTYTYVWKTNKAWANSCRQLSVELDDGTVHTALFKFTK